MEIPPELAQAIYQYLIKQPLIEIRALVEGLEQAAQRGKEAEGDSSSDSNRPESP